MRPSEAGLNTFTLRIAVTGCSRYGRIWRTGCKPILGDGIKSEIEAADICDFRGVFSMIVMAYLKCRRQRVGRG